LTTLIVWIDFMKSEEEDRKKLKKINEDNEKEKEDQLFKMNYEQTVKDLAQKKKKDLPAEPKEGKISDLMSRLHH